MRPGQMRIERHWGEPVGSLSDYWRVDRSSDRSRELSSILGGAAAQAELVQRRLQRSGRTAYRRPLSPVILDPKLLSGFAAPIPGIVVDCLVGLAVREAAFRELSAESSLWSGWQDLDEESRREFAQLHRAMEEVYVSTRLRRLSRTLAEYLRVMRRTMMPWRPVAVREGTVSPSRGTILRIWLGWRLYGVRPPADLNAGLLDAVASLDERANRYLKATDALQRAELAGDIWKWLSGFPSGRSYGEGWWFGEADEDFIDDRHAETRRQLCWNAQGGGESGSLMDLASVDVAGARPLPPDVRGEPDAPGGEEEVVTGELRELGIRAAVTAIRNARYDPVEYERARAETAREIESVRHLFSRLEEARARWRYGLRRGKLDGRGLTRVAAGKERVFKRRDRQQGCSMALVFLVDVSASMRSHVPVVNRAACVVSEALGSLAPRVWYEVLTYTSAGLQQGAPVQLSRLAASGSPLSLRDVWTNGGTPSGEAIAAALLELRGRTAERKLVLHFTDGHPKDTYVVRQALELGRRSGIDVLTISVGAPQEALYGEGKCEVAYSVTELPAVLARLLPRLYH